MKRVFAVSLLEILSVKYSYRSKLAFLITRISVYIHWVELHTEISIRRGSCDWIITARDKRILLFTFGYFWYPTALFYKQPVVRFWCNYRIYLLNFQIGFLIQYLCIKYYHKAQLNINIIQNIPLFGAKIASSYCSYKKSWLLSGYLLMRLWLNVLKTWAAQSTEKLHRWNVLQWSWNHSWRMVQLNLMKNRGRFAVKNLRFASGTTGH